jgi:hypothetical protein
MHYFVRILLAINLSYLNETIRKFFNKIKFDLLNLQMKKLIILNKIY